MSGQNTNTAYQPGIDGPALSIRECFDRYERMAYWVVSRGRGESATFQTWIYGNRLAEQLAQKLYRAARDSGDWK